LTDIIGKIEQLTEYNAYDPNQMTERCQKLHDRYFELLEKTKRLEEIFAELREMAVEIEYICKM